MLWARCDGRGLRKKKGGMRAHVDFNPQKFFGLRSKRRETPVLTRFGMHVITRTLATGSQGFDPKRGILLRPYPITSACPPPRTPKPTSFLANSDPLRHNPTCSAPHPSRTPFHCPSDPPDFRSDVSPSCPLVPLAVGRVPMTHKAHFCYCFFVP